jgi:hypothetical protein
MVAIDDSNWYIKRLNNMEIDKKKSVILGCYIKIIGWEDFDTPPNTPLSHWASISRPHTPDSHVLNP